MREADARDAQKDEEEKDERAGLAPLESYEVPEKIVLDATGPHVLLAGVRKLALETDYEPEEWSLRMPYDNFVLTLARDANGEGALFEQRLGAGRILLAAGGTLFTNRALGNDDNARLFANIVSVTAGAATAWCCSTICARACRPVTIPRASTATRACIRPSSSC